MKTPDNDPFAAAREEFAETGVGRSLSATPGEHPGDTIDRYKLLQEIGEGGMGTVWMAEQREPVKRQVALKIIKLGMDTKGVVARFEAERQALALMDHPNIARVLDGGATETGRPFFVMELVRGVPITRFCDDSNLGLTERLRLFTAVCSAIQHAHHKGIIHRDIKPSNVMVTLHDSVPVPKVIDFGIAKATSVELTQKTMFTQYGSMIGTPEYMAPEQAEMSGLDIDTRADVYSLGVLLYELLTGTKPFEIGEVLERGYQELLRTIREDSPARPSTRVSTLGGAAQAIAKKRHANVQGLSSRLRGELDWIVMRALEKDRTRRYETANGFAADIARYLDGEPVQAVPPSSLYRLRKFVARRRKTVVSVAAMLLLLVAGTIGTGIGWWNTQKANARLEVANEQKDGALREAQDARVAAVASEQAARAAESAAMARADELAIVTAFQARQLRQLDPRLIGESLREALVAGAPPERREQVAQLLRDIDLTSVGLDNLITSVIEPTVAAVDAQFAGQPALRGRLLMATAKTLRGLGRMTDAEPVLQKIRELPVGDGGIPLETRLTADILLGYVLCIQREYERGDRLLRETLERARREMGEHPVTGAAEIMLGCTLTTRSLFEEAELHLTAGMRMLEEECARTGIDPETSGELDVARESMLIVLLARAEYARAEEIARAVLATRLAASGNSSATAWARITLARVMYESGRAKEAAAESRRAYDYFVAHSGRDSTSTIHAALELGNCLLRLSRPDEADAIATPALESARRLYAEDSRPVRMVKMLLAKVRAEQGRADESAALADSVAPVTAGAGAGAYEQVSVLFAKADALRVSGRVAESLEAYRKALAAGAELPEDDSRMLNVRHGIGWSLSLLGRNDEALPWIEQAFAGACRIHGRRNPTTLNMGGLLASVLVALKRPEEGEPLLHEVFDAYTEQLGASDPKTLIAKFSLASVWRDQGKLEQAIAAGEEVHAAMKRTLGPLHIYTLQIGNRLAPMYTRAKRFDEAEHLFRVTLDGMRKTIGDRHLETGLTLRGLAVALFESGQGHEASERYSEALEILAQAGFAGLHVDLFRCATLELERGPAAAAERHLRELIALRSAVWGGDWRRANTDMLLGLALAKQGRFAEGEPLLVDGAEAVVAAFTGEPDALPNAQSVHIALAAAVEFYELWQSQGTAEEATAAQAAAKAARWRERRDARD